MEVTIATLLTAIGSIFSEAVEWVGDVASAVVSSPILLLFIVIPLVGLGVGMFKRLLNVN